MSDAALESLRFPVGRFTADPNANIAAMIDQIAAAPGAIAALIDGMTPEQLRSPYRPDGWTVAQVVHHVADSHINAYIRTRFALAEDNFTVKPYDEGQWAQFVDATSPDVTPSLSILTGLHARWVALLRTLTPDQLARPLLHPERGPMTINWLVQLYAWHGRHHAGHIAAVKRRN